MTKKYYIDEKPLVNNLLLLDGFTRVGKFFLGKMLAGIKDVDYFQAISILEQLPVAFRLGALSEGAAIALIRKTLDENAYNQRIGRNLNTRFADASSIYNYPEFEIYLRKTTSNFGEISLTHDLIIKDFWSNFRYSFFILHEVLPNIEIYFKAYPNLKMINLIRNPIDVIHSCFLRKWGARFGTDPLSFSPALMGQEVPIPWYAADWQEEYKDLAEIDRVIKCISSLSKMCENSFSKLTLQQKSQIHFIRYENLVENTLFEIESICSFLSTQVSDCLPEILAREKCPKNISIDNRKVKLDYIRSISSTSCYEMMIDLVSEYEEKVVI